jgi:lipopolysaccharide export system protein LptC
LNVISKLPVSARLSLALLLILLVVYLLRGESSQQSTHFADHKSSDYSMSDFAITSMNKQGQPVRVLRGEYMAHFPKDDTTEISHPIGDFIQLDDDDWQVTADHGITSGKGEEILLTGNVQVVNQRQTEIKLLTEQLTINTVYNTAYTDKAATITSPKGDTHSVGMDANLNDRFINLHSRVKGIYDAPPTH